MRNIALITALLVAIFSAAVRPAAAADTLEVLGQTGEVGEWELTANITSADTGRHKVFSGPLAMKHVALCTQDGLPLIKKGEIQLQLLSAARVRATLMVAGVTCTYEGRKFDSFNGVMRCPNERDVLLKIWIK